MIDFTGRVAIVTGAGSGLGRAHALLLASRGAKVVVNDPGGSLNGSGGDTSVADHVVAEIRAAGGEASANYASVADRDGAASIVGQAIDEFGGIHIVVNNAGILRDRTFARMSLDDFELVMQVHFYGTVYVTHAAWPHLLDQAYGRVVFTTSASGISSAPFGQSNYGAAKGAMLGLMNNLANEGRKKNVLVNMIGPVAATRMTEGVFPESQFNLSMPDRVSPAVAYMCSEECTFTGRTLVAGAGYFARAQMMRTKGTVLAPGRIPTIEDVAASIETIADLAGAEPYTSTISAEAKKQLGIA